jgi:hypothetical protein
MTEENHNQETWVVTIPAELVQAIEAKLGKDYKQSAIITDSLWHWVACRPAPKDDNLGVSQNLEYSGDTVTVHHPCSGANASSTMQRYINGGACI